MKKIFKILKREKMTAAEKEKLNRVVKLTMQNFPAETTQTSAWARWSFSRSQLRLTMALASLAVIFLISGGTALAAEQALPGDILYPVKIKVNEKIREKLSLGEEAKTKWQTEQVERRLVEMEKLAEKSQLKEKKLAEVTERYTEQTKNIENKITDLRSQGKAVRAAALEKTLNLIEKKHEQKLNKIINKDNDEQTKKEVRHLVEPLKLLHSKREQLDQDKEKNTAQAPSSTTPLRLVTPTKNSGKSDSRLELPSPKAVNIREVKQGLRKIRQDR